MLTEQQNKRLEEWAHHLGRRIYEVPDINAAGVSASTREFLGRRPAALAYDDVKGGAIYVFSERMNNDSIEHIDNVIACEVLSKEGPGGIMKSDLYEWNRSTVAHIPDGIKYAMRAYLGGGRIPDSVLAKEYLMNAAVHHDRREFHAQAIWDAAAVALEHTCFPIDRNRRDNLVGYTAALEQYYASEKIKELRTMTPADFNSRLATDMETFRAEKMRVNTLIPFGEVSPALRFAHVKGDALFMAATLLWDKATKHEMDKHHLDYYDLAESIRNPLAVFRNYSVTDPDDIAADRFVVLTDIPVISETGHYPTFLTAVIEANGEKMMNRGQTVISIHPKSNIGIVKHVFESVGESNMDNKILYIRDDFEKKWLTGLDERIQIEVRKKREYLQKKKNRGVKSLGIIRPVDPETTVSIAKIVKIWKNKHADELFLMRQPHDDEYAAPKFFIGDSAMIRIEREERKIEKIKKTYTPKTVLSADDFKAEKTFRTVSEFGVKTVADLLTKRDIINDRLSATARNDVDSIIKAATPLPPKKKLNATEKRLAAFKEHYLGNMVRAAFPDEPAAQIKYDTGSIIVLVAGNKYNAMNLKGERLLKEHVDWIAPPKEGFARIMKRKAGEIKYNFIDADGKVLLKNWVDKASDFRNGQATVEIGSKKKVVDTSGRVTADEDINAGQSKGHPGL